MSRSRGWTPFIRAPPMRISPSVIVSRPAVIRSSVVFPQPDGPRRTTNWLSGIVKEMSSMTFTGPKDFPTRSYSTVAIT